MLGVRGTHLDSSSRHLFDEDGFGGFSAVGTVADDRPPAYAAAPNPGITQMRSPRRNTRSPQGVLLAVG